MEIKFCCIFELVKIKIFISLNIIDNHVELHDAVIPYEKGATFLWYLEELVKPFLFVEISVLDFILRWKFC